MATMENAIFWIEIDKIHPNPYQPRREFEENALAELAESIKQYGILQPLVISRDEVHNPDGSIESRYELIAGERRLRASRLANIFQVPCIIRIGHDSREKLELAIIENVVRADLNPVERAMAYQQLAEEFKLNWVDIAKKVSKSREYVSNTVRILMLPQEMLEALTKGKISEGHTRPLLMLTDRAEEQATLFKEMLLRKMTVREAESLARRIAYDKVRKKSVFITPEVVEMEENLASSLGTRVTIEPKERGGKISIDYFSHDELMGIANLIKVAGVSKTHQGMFDKIRADGATIGVYTEEISVSNSDLHKITPNLVNIHDFSNSDSQDISNDNIPLDDDRDREETFASRNTDIEATDDIADLYSINKFTL